MLQKISMIRVEPRHDKGLTDWQNMFALMRFCYIKVFFLYTVHFSVSLAKNIVPYLNV